MFVDSAGGPGPLVQAWLASGRQLAVTVGSMVALVSLFADAPVRIASLRGAIAWGAVLALVSAGSWITPRVFQARPEADDEDLTAEGADATTEVTGP
ncbi:MAG: hypothetical protein AAF957_05715 [Planctomycetota bacterium]